MDNVLQLPDDKELLRTFALDQEAAPAAYRPALFWAGHQQKAIRHLEQEGLVDIRRQEKSEFIGFVPNDSGYRRDAVRTIQGIGALDEAQKQQLFNLVEVACLNPELGLLPFGLSVSDIERLAYDMSDCAGRANGAAPPESGWDSLAGNPHRHFTVGDRTYTYEWLRYYYLYAHFSRFVDFSKVDSIVEVGPGLGMQAEVIRKLHPQVRYYLLDNGAQSYVCHQNMKTLFADAVVDYRTLREREAVTLDKPGEIAVLGNWQIKRLRPEGTTLFWSCGTLCSMEESCFADYLAFMRERPDVLCLMEHVHGMKDVSEGAQKLLDANSIVNRLEDRFQCLGREPLRTPLNRKKDSAGFAENICLARRGTTAAFLRASRGE